MEILQLMVLGVGLRHATEDVIYSFVFEGKNIN